MPSFPTSSSNHTSSARSSSGTDQDLPSGANSIVFGLMGLLCVLAPIIVNKIGVKRTLILGTLGWAPYSAALCESTTAGRSSAF